MSQQRAAPARCNLSRPACSNQDPAQPKREKGKFKDSFAAHGRPLRAVTPPKSPVPHPSLPNGLLWVSSLGPGAGGRGIGKVRLERRGVSKASRAPRGLRDSASQLSAAADPQDLHCKAGAPGALHTTATSSAGPAGPCPTGLAREVQEETQGHLPSGPDPCEYGKAAGPLIQGVSPSLSTQESFRCEGVSGVDTEEVSKNQRWTRAVCLPTTQSLGPDH